MGTCPSTTASIQRLARSDKRRRAPHLPAVVHAPRAEETAIMTANIPRFLDRVRDALLQWLLRTSVHKMESIRRLKPDNSHCCELLQAYIFVPSLFSFSRVVSRFTEKRQKQQVGYSQQIRFIGRVVSRFTTYNLNIFAKKVRFRPLQSQDLRNPTNCKEITSFIPKTSYVAAAPPGRKPRETLQRSFSFWEFQVKFTSKRRTHEEYRWFSCHHSDLFVVNSIDSILVWGIKHNEKPHC